MEDSAGGQDADLQRLTNLATSCRAAPRFGKNAKELVLQAVGEIEDDFEIEPLPASTPARASIPVPVSSPPTQKALLTVEELFLAFPPEERPYIAYKPNQKVPRITRQRQVDDLAGKYLGFLLQEKLLTTKQEWLNEIQGNEPLRAAALQAANQHELKIYTSAYNETSYKNAMYAVVTERSFVNEEWWKAQAPTRFDSSCSSTDQTDMELHGASNLKQQPSTETIPEDAKEGGDRPAKLPRLDSVSEAPSDESHTSAPLPPPSDQSNISNQLVLFIKTILDPYYTAAVVDRETYRKIVKRVKIKVMAAHPEATTAGFIAREGESIRRLIQRHIECYTTVKK